MTKYTDQPAKLVLGALSNQLNNTIILFYKLAYPHNLPSFLKTYCINIQFTADPLQLIFRLMLCDTFYRIYQFQRVDQGFCQFISSFYLVIDFVHVFEISQMNTLNIPLFFICFFDIYNDIMQQYQVIVELQFFIPNTIQMTEASEDYQYDDRQSQLYEGEQSVRQQIARIPAHQSFDVSSFAQSKSGIELSKYLSKGFPVSNAPTLQVSPQSKLNFQLSHSNKITKPENIKSRNQFSQSSKISNLQQQIQYYKKELSDREIREDGYIIKIQEINNINLKLEQLIRDKDCKIREKQELILAQQRKYKQVLLSSEKNGVHSQQKSKKSYIDDFCPQFLSPEESLQLFTELLTKIQKSTSLKKKIGRDRKITSILSQLLKTQ